MMKIKYLKNADGDIATKMILDDESMDFSYVTLIKNLMDGIIPEVLYEGDFSEVEQVQLSSLLKDIVEIAKDPESKKDAESELEMPGPNYDDGMPF